MSEALGMLADGSAPLDLSLETLIGSHLCIQANSGAGKSGAIRKVLEITHRRIQHIVIDTEDEFYTLREKFEYLIAGGDNGDCAATVNNAAALAMTILETGFSAIVQINSLSFDDRCTFIREFLQALTNAPKRLWRPALIVLDEAQFYAPQKGYATSLEAIVSFMMLGRKRGFTGILATPRPADLSKQATSPVNNWMIGRCGQPVDRRAAADALGFAAKSPEALNLKSLVARQFWAFGPALTNEPVLSKIGPTLTTIVKAGQATLPTPPAPAAMQKILASLNAAAVKKEDADEAETAKPAQNITENITFPDPQLIAEAEQRGYAAGYERGGADMAASAKTAFEATREAIAGALTMLDAQIAVAGDKAMFAEVDPPSAFNVNFPPIMVGRIPADRAPAEAPRSLPLADTSQAAGGQITSAMKETLHALAWWARLGHRAPTKKQIGGLLGIIPDGSTMRSRLASLSTAGMIEYPTPGTVALTAAGKAAAPPVSVAATLVETIRGTLTTTQRETFDAIPARRGATISKEELGAKLGGIDATGSTMRSRLAELSNRELIAYPKAGLVARQDWVIG